jgi:hypothetical protein
VVETGFMESALFETDPFTDLEPGIPGGETPPSTAGGTPAATEAGFMESALFETDLFTAHEPRNCKSLEINETISRFMGSALFETDLFTDLEPGIPGGETPPSTAGGTPAATEAGFMESHLFEIDLLTAHEPRNCKSLEINETIPRFMGSGVGAGVMLTDHEPGIPGGETPAGTHPRYMEVRVWTGRKDRSVKRKPAGYQGQRPVPYQPGPTAQVRGFP